MQIGIDLETSEVKLVVVDDDDRTIAAATRALGLSRPHPTWSEPDPRLWWRATEEALDELATREPAAIAAVRAIGLSGRMHGAVLLDSQNQVLRPAILWNDSRAARECEEFEARCAESRRSAAIGQAAVRGDVARVSRRGRTGGRAGGRLTCRSRLSPVRCLPCNARRQRTPRRPTQGERAIRSLAGSWFAHGVMSLTKQA
jgi:hypothetical protein